MKGEAGDNDFAAHALRLGLAWVALLVLMTASLVSSYFRLGAANLIVGLGIATLKSAIVVWLFMEMRIASATTRIVALVAMLMLGVLFALSGVDFLTRLDDPARVQAPQQIAPLVAEPAADAIAPR